MIPTIQPSDLQTFYDVMSTKDFVVLGEMHGSRQNAPLLQQLIEVFLKKKHAVTVAFEWALDESQLDALNSYIHGGKVPNALPEFFLDSDGRFTLEHALLLKWIRERNGVGNIINLLSFDLYESVKNRDLAMANVLADYKKQSDDIVIVETGNLHARKSPTNIGRQSMVSFLTKDYSTYSIFVQYRDGEINVEGMNFDVTQSSTQQHGPDNFFDAIIEIEHSEGSPNPLNLTQIAKMLI